MVTIYTKDDCIQCKMTKKHFDVAGVEYKEINLDKNPEYIPKLKERGIGGAPAVFFGQNEFFVGFQPSKIKQLAKVMGSK